MFIDVKCLSKTKGEEKKSWSEKQLSKRCKLFAHGRLRIDFSKSLCFFKVTWKSSQFRMYKRRKCTANDSKHRFMVSILNVGHKFCGLSLSKFKCSSALRVNFSQSILVFRSFSNHNLLCLFAEWMISRLDGGGGERFGIFNRKA